MSDRLEIKITGTNTASPVFRQITADAQAMGTTVDQAGQKSARSLQDLNLKAAAFGAAIGAATGLMANFTRSAAEDEASVVRVEQAITNAGDSLDDYSAKLEAAIKVGQRKAFSDDQTRDALVKLNLVTNDTQASLDQLGLAMDFARAKGMSLSTSAEVIAKVYGGNLGILTRYGIVLDEGATKEEALAAIQARTAGQAQRYADTSIGNLDRQKDRLGELTEGWGAHAGQLSEVLLLLPGLTAAYTSLGAAIGGISGAAGLATTSLKLLGPAALLAGGGSLAYGYSQDSIGTTATNEFWNNFFKKGSEIMNALLPGNPYDTQKYNDQIDSNRVGDVINTILRQPGEAQSVVWDRVAALTGTITGEMSDEELKNFVVREATRVGLTAGAYLIDLANKAGYVTDPVTGVRLSASDYAYTAGARSAFQNPYALVGSGRPMLAGPSGSASHYYGDIQQTGYIGPYQPAARTVTGGAYADPTYLMPPEKVRLLEPVVPGAFMPIDEYYDRGTGSGYGIGAGPFTGTGRDTATGAGSDLGGGLARSAAAAIQEQAKAYYGLATASEVATRGLSEFKQVQDHILERESIYSQQISEFQSQVDAQDAAYEILNQRREDGVELSAKELKFLDNYAQANARGTGAVEDATIALGMQAQAYLLNMEKGDALNRTIAESSESVGELVDVIQLLILSLDNVPPEVRTRIELERAAEAQASLATIVGLLNQLNGGTATYYINEVRNGVSIGRPNGPGILPLDQLHGGIPGYANGGVTFRGGEAGPEYFTTPRGRDGLLLTDGYYSLPRGSMVTPAPASKGRGGGGITINGNVIVYANDPQQFTDALREHAIGSSRS